ncbi:TetR/AcrR family transcriptional regulator [Bradyrhizobium sp. NP1]|uniref:TetR/AcrR family transcriptional regulator n=1 Tax=Bradyrhizobium sp. NP1 TaxID=3049772 RepID=UPI0025A5AC58|nr:TetR/AcrR family transcriptional regulator [Bradyrhizobium sp. NP1]WJR76874.1 TetR/AcrR family transcriptional regulator [Bradyrhizobium sp. NP1]
MKQNEKIRPGSRARKRNDILVAGKKVFLERGYGATSMDEIALQANVSKRTVYDKFENKQTLFAAVVQEICERIAPPEFLATDMHKDVKTVLTQFGEWFLTRIYSIEQVNLFQTVINDSRQFPEIGDMFLSGPVLRTQTALAAYLAAQVQKGRLALKDPQIAAALLIAMMKSDVHMTLLLGQSRSNLPKLIRQHVATAVSLFLTGAQNPKERS